MKPPKFDRILIDGDCALFRAGFAGQRVIYHIVDKDDEDTVLASSQDKKALQQMIIDELDPDVHEVVGVTDIEPFENVKHNLHMLFEGIETAVGRHPRTIYLSDPTGASFRKALDPSYKANRDPSQKPFWYEELRYYLLKHYDCIEASRGMEADDLLGIEQVSSKDKTVIASVDKDLKQIPGWHYNIMHRRLFYMSPEEADLWVWHQMLIGDVADNIKGIHMIGEVKAEKLLRGKNPEEAEGIVRELYEQHKGPDWEDAFEINRQLLTILRREK